MVTLYHFCCFSENDFFSPFFLFLFLIQMASQTCTFCDCFIACEKRKERQVINNKKNKRGVVKLESWKDIYSALSTFNIEDRAPKSHRSFVLVRSKRNKKGTRYRRPAKEPQSQISLLRKQKRREEKNSRILMTRFKESRDLSQISRPETENIEIQIVADNKLEYDMMNDYDEAYNRVIASINYEDSQYEEMISNINCEVSQYDRCDLYSHCTCEDCE